MENSKTKLEISLREFIIKFEKEYLGRGPEDVKIYILDDMIMFRLKGVLTRAEVHLAKTQNGKLLVKEIRRELIESLKLILKKKIEQITGKKVKSLHTDISVKTGERVIIIIFTDNIIDE